MELPLRFAGIVLLGFSLSCQAGTHQDSRQEPNTGRFVQASASAAASIPATQDEAATWSPQEGLPALLRRAQQQSPHVQVAFHDWQVRVEQIDQVTALPDPWLNLGAYLQSVETRSGPMDGRIGINQKFPWPGKLDAAGEKAAALAEATRWGIEEARLQVRSAFLKQWTEMAYLQQAIAITGSQVVLLEHIEDVSLRLYESSRVSQADVLRAQVERLQMEDRLATLEQKTHNLLPRLERTLGASLDPSADWSGVDVPLVPELASADTLEQRFHSRSPSMRRLVQEMDAAFAARTLADLEDRPDFAIGADWTWIGQGNVVSANAGEDAFSLSLAVELPLQRGRIDAARRQALAEQRRVSAALEETRWDLIASMGIALSDMVDADRRQVLYRDRLLPKGEETYETTLVAYQSGQSGFQDMLDAARVILDFRLAAVRAASDAHLAYAALSGLLPPAALLPESTER